MSVAETRSRRGYSAAASGRQRRRLPTCHVRDARTRSRDAEPRRIGATPQPTTRNRVAAAEIATRAAPAPAHPRAFRHPPTPRLPPVPLPRYVFTRPPRPFPHPLPRDAAHGDRGSTGDGVRRREGGAGAQAGGRERLLVPELPPPVQGERRAARARARGEGRRTPGAGAARRARLRRRRGRRLGGGGAADGNGLRAQSDDPGRRRPGRLVSVVHPGASRPPQPGDFARAAHRRDRVRPVRRRPGDRGLPRR